MGTRKWEWPSAHSALTLTITHSLTNAQRSAAQAAPPSAGFNGLQALAMIKMKRKKNMIQKMMKLSLYGEKLLQPSPKANAAPLIVPNAVKAGMKMMIRP